MSEYKSISSEELWVPGTTYELSYDIDHVSLFGVNLPDALVPDALRERLTKQQIDSAIRKLETDPRYEVLGYQVYGTTFTIEVIARTHASPVRIIAYAVIGIVLIFGIALSLREVRKAVEAIAKNPELPKALHNFSIALVIGAALAAFLVLRKQVPV